MSISSGKKSRTVLEMTGEEARSFFLKAESYCGFDLPPYFSFGPIVSEAAKFLQGKELPGLCEAEVKPKYCEGVNHLLLTNKDGRHAWRPFELIHPALYANLVNTITDESNWSVIKAKFAEFQALGNIRCLSLPIEASDESSDSDKEAQILNWWSDVEQRSIELALEYETLGHADITDCYGQIYTHSIAWALHTKVEIKKPENRNNKSFVGNVIDARIQDMRHGQTNGIPQGSVLMDFVAEMVLGYADTLLHEKLNSQGVMEYQILRYRDDYRIFVHGGHDGEKILKALTEVLIELGFKLNSSKTVISSDVVGSSVKADKLAWISRKQADKNLEKHLLIIHQHAADFPNSGSLLRALSEFRARLDRVKNCESVPVLISIVADIAYNSPRTYPICAAILSRLLAFLKSKTDKQQILDKIVKKFARIPNTAYMEVWLQRIALPLGLEVPLTEPLCKVAAEMEAVDIWNSEWVASADLKAILATPIIDKEAIGTLDEVIPADEVELFLREHSL